jgi:hypothetical protein
LPKAEEAQAGLACVFQVLPEKQASRRNRYYPHALRPAELPSKLGISQVFDLLKLLGMGGRWGAEMNFVRYFEELRRPFEEIDWSFVLSMLADYFAMGGQWDERFCRVAEQCLGPVAWDQVRQLHRFAHPEPTIRQLDPKAQGVLRELIARHTPIRRYVFRNTRTLLREYYQRGLLKE